MNTSVCLRLPSFCSPQSFRKICLNTTATARARGRATAHFQRETLKGLNFFPRYTVTNATQYQWRTKSVSSEPKKPEKNRKTAKAHNLESIWRRNNPIGWTKWKIRQSNHLAAQHTHSHSSQHPPSKISLFSK